MFEGEIKIVCMVIVGILIFLLIVFIYLYDVMLKFIVILNFLGIDCIVGVSEI